MGAMNRSGKRRSKRFCRYCKQPLPPFCWFFCPPPPPYMGQDGKIVEPISCMQKFADIYASPYYDNVDPLDLILSPDEKGDARARAEELLDLIGYVELMRRPKKLYYLCLECEHPCKISVPDPECSFTLACRKTKPELFQ